MKIHYDIFEGRPLCKTNAKSPRVSEEAAEVDCKNCNKCLQYSRMRSMIKYYQSGKV